MVPKSRVVSDQFIPDERELFLGQLRGGMYSYVVDELQTRVKLQVVVKLINHRRLRQLWHFKVFIAFRDGLYQRKNLCPSTPNIPL